MRILKRCIMASIGLMLGGDIHQESRPRSVDAACTTRPLLDLGHIRLTVSQSVQ